MAYNFTAIEKKWQQYWLENKAFRALDPGDAATCPRRTCWTCSRIPAVTGLHVGHVEGSHRDRHHLPDAADEGVQRAAPDGLGRVRPARGAVRDQDQRAPGRARRAERIDNFRRQIQALGMSYDWDREVDTTDPQYYRWTQWIFLQLFNSYFDPIDQKAKPIGHLVNELVNENFVVAPDGEIMLNPHAGRHGSDRWRSSARAHCGASCRPTSSAT